MRARREWNVNTAAQYSLPVWANDLTVGKRTLGEQIDRQPRFAVHYGKDASDVSLVPLTSAAKSLLARPEGASVQRQLGQLLSASKIPRGAVQGVALSTGRDGLAANKFVSDASLGYQEISQEPDPLSMMFTNASLQGYRSNYAKLDKSGAAAFGGPWLILGPAASRVAVSAARGKPDHDTASLYNNFGITHLLRHEAQHAVTPANDKTYPRYKWLEEATAETLGRWPGAITATAKAMGIPTKAHPIQESLSSSEGGAQYNTWSASLRSLLRLGGIDTRRGDSLPAAYELLQKPALSRVPGKLADAIVEHNNLPPGMRETVREFIVQTQGDPKSIASLVDYIKSAQR